MAQPELLKGGGGIKKSYLYCLHITLHDKKIEVIRMSTYYLIKYNSKYILLKLIKYIGNNFLFIVCGRTGLFVTSDL